MNQSRFWQISHRADPASCKLADRHYSRQKPGSPQFVPPGRCVVLRTPERDAVWTTSWPFAEYVKHEWAGAWICSIFRNESPHLASDMILEAIAVTRAHWEPPELGMVTFVDPRKVPPVVRRGKPIYGYCFLKAGFRHVGFTKGKLWAWQLLPEAMPESIEPFSFQKRMFA